MLRRLRLSARVVLRAMTMTISGASAFLWLVTVVMKVRVLRRRVAGTTALPKLKVVPSELKKSNCGAIILLLGKNEI